ncbi:MAG: extracellular solute-binding protein [Propionibacteriaceae bacterium]|nr:extracellular solute-binding protein [Propionibacteriaceae bacterium]
MRVRMIAIGVAVMLALGGCGAPEPRAQDISLWLVQGSTPAPVQEYLIQQYAIYNGGRLSISEMPARAVVVRGFEAKTGDFERPDVIEMPDYATTTLAANEAFSDISDLYSSYGGSHLVSALTDLGIYEGKHYTLPYQFTTKYVYYRKDIWALAGIEKPPSTLDDLHQGAITVTDKNPRRIDDFSGFFLANQDWHDGVSWIYARGGEIARRGEDGLWESTLSDPQTLSALRELQQLHAGANRAPWDSPVDRPWIYLNDIDWIYDETGTNVPTSVSAATIMADDSMRTRVGDRVRTEMGTRTREWNSDTFGAFALPGADGGVAPSHLRGSTIGIIASSPRQQGARDLLDIIYSRDFQTMLGRVGLGAGNEDYWEFLGDDEFAEMTTAIARAATSTPTAPGWLYVEQSGELQAFFTRVVRGGDIESLASQYDDILTPLLNTLEPPG